MHFNRYLLILILTCAFADAGEIIPQTSQIVGGIADGNPQEPELPKTGFIVPAKDILTTKTLKQDGRTITVQEINPIPLPPHPHQAPPVDVADPAVQQKLSESSGEHFDAGILFIAASVFHAKNSQVLTLATLTPPGSGKSVTLWSSADFALLSGFTSFTSSDGITRSLMMAWSPQEVESLNHLLAENADESGISTVPNLPEGKASFAITEGNPDKETLITIQSLHDLYNNEHDRLKTAYESREQFRLQQEAELKTHPPKPKNIVLSFWRTESSAPAAKGGTH